MAAIDKLLGYLQASNIASKLDDDQHKEIADQVILGYQIDSDSRSKWLETNQEAMKIVKHCEDDSAPTKDFPFPDACKVIYPLLSPAIIQLASRLVQHIVRNNRTVECAVLGKDEPIEQPPTQMGQMPQGMPPELMAQMGGQQQQVPIPTVFKKASKAKRVSDFLNYELLIESDSWLKDTHKLCHILAAWGTAFRQVYYDPITKTNCDELIPPEDVIINHNLTSLDKAKRITVRHYMTKNDLIEKMRSDQFVDYEIDLFSTLPIDNEKHENDFQETDPVHEILCQFCYVDLDGDGYAEPYKVYVHNKSRKLLGIYAAFELNDINLNEKGIILSINPRIDIVDFHLIDDPEGKFYSLGLNYLLLHQNKSITSILRNLIDSGTLANQQGGFVTKAFKTKERVLRFQMGEFPVLDVNPNVNPKDHIIPLPFKEPSQVLLALLQVLIEGGKETGFITDVLTGDIQGQNVPATTMLSMVEQGTRAFKPVIQKLYSSLKKEFKLWFHYHALYLNETKYARFNNEVLEISKDDFDESVMDICPVADPTQSSESHKYARLQAMVQMVQIIPQAHNQGEILKEYYDGMGFENPERFLAPPPDPAQNPDMLKLQLAQQKQQSAEQISQLKIQLQVKKQEMEQMKVALKAQETQRKSADSEVKQQKMAAEVFQNKQDLAIKHQLANTAQFKAHTDREKLKILKSKSNDS